MGSERREYERLEWRFPIQYRRVGGLLDPWRNGFLLNLSAGGFRVTAEEQFDAGTKLEFQITLPIRPDPYSLVGEVISEATLTSGMEYGVVLRELSPDKQYELDELVQFLSKHRSATSGGGGSPPPPQTGGDPT